VGLSYRVRGPYFESCNCEAICPCRMVGGVIGGRSTYGLCFGVLCWQIDDGFVGDVDVSGLGVVLVIRYHDDEPGSPWSVILHLDERGDGNQLSALEQLFLHELRELPWIRKQRQVIDVRASTVEIDGTHVRVGDRVTVRATQRVETDQPVACGIPGYDRVGHELYADELHVEDGPFSYRLEGNCAFATDFDYRSG
jgi:Protein of unknown function (DUF1326)